MVHPSMTQQRKGTRTLAAAVAAGDRRALSRAITLVESSRVDHREEAEDLLAQLMPGTGGACRLGISGAPGVGKSSFIEALGRRLTGAGHKVAVLAVDPTSARTGGSILGDKTRMPELARDANAYIRPSPSGSGVGGVARRTREAVLLAEAAGFDVVVVETVGIGQSDIVVESVVDTFLLLVAPGGGGELQGIKRGVMELADLVVITKADGELRSAAQHAAADYGSALALIRPKMLEWTPAVVLVSAREGTGIDEVWDAVQSHRAVLEQSGALEGRRAEQAVRWMWIELEQGLKEALAAHPEVKRLLQKIESEVAAGRSTPTAAARRLLAAFRG